PCVGRLVRFLKELMPLKRTAELYISLGFHKHGKTELYKDLLDHRQVCGLDRFVHARGQPGMVMISFNMEQDELIYKLIRDRFAQPKKTTRQDIMQRYDYVFKHDRAGRLVDVQTFENLTIETCCFTPELLEEIGSQARQTVSVSDNQVILHHVYVERRVTPLDVYLESASFEDGRKVVIDYGQAIKDLAQVDVFPGDLLIKNFGVTRLGRVVFYDYDELCPLSQCNFRRMPKARRYEDELEAEPWFTVDQNDVFPEELLTFIGLPAQFLPVFKQHHSDLLQPDYWNKVQRQISDGQWMPILPYGMEQRLHPIAD
ncbi:MAG: bifunctional isocitrate dehydrogenase kinase/phosphatase, partial [Desulfosarcinaceae bacterium]